MYLRIVALPNFFRLSTSHVYPPFKNGKYMEEYIYEYLTKHQERIETNWVYIPIFWTNLQNHPAFSEMKARYRTVLQIALQIYPKNTQFFTCVQHDDGPQLPLPPQTVIFGACSGNRILPLIYEDTTDRLLNTPRIPWKDKDLLASFVGTLSTHSVRQLMHDRLNGKKDIVFHSRGVWSVAVKGDDAEQFIAITNRSRFCLAPRGYGRSSFRFFEAMLMDVVPVYVWDDSEWLPYKEELDYSKFSVSISSKDLPYLYEILSVITEEEYEKMIEEIRRVRSYFTLEGMCQWLEKQLVL
jgi:hypothetical protein